VLVYFFGGEIQFLRQSYEDYMDEKHYHDQFPYSQSNDSHLQLTHGRSRLSQSEL